MDSWMNSNQTRKRNVHRIMVKILCTFLAVTLFPLLCHAEPQTAVEKKFETFALNWIFRIETAYLHTRKTPKIEFINGRYQASFHQIVPDSIQTDVKPASGSSTIFTGVLQYHEYLFQSTGDTQSRALAGPFEPVSLKKMTEIFLYENGSWIR